MVDKAESAMWPTSSPSDPSIPVCSTGARGQGPPPPWGGRRRCIIQRGGVIL